VSAHPVSPLAPARWPDLPVVAGVRATTLRVGFYKHAREDMLVVALPAGATAAGAFTTSTTRSADVDWCRDSLSRSGGSARALVVNAGNSNAFTGAAGLAKNAATVAAAVKALGCAPEQVLLSATGVIGVPVAADVLAARVPEAVGALGAPDWQACAKAIMTTDTFAKAAGVTVKLGGKPVNIVGIAKGSGMIAPNMATMLVYLFTDADVSAEVLQAFVHRHIGTTFNCITVDGDTSTSDTLLAFATGASGAAPILSPTAPGAAAFSRALGQVMRELAHLVVRDGEGATRFVTVQVTGAASPRAAKAVAAAIANSPLVKTALAAADANWGRVVAAVGKSGERVDRDRIAVSFGGLAIAQDGERVASYDEAAVTAHLQGKEVNVHVDLGVGRGKATVWTCDLTHGYVTINGAYRT
jgi:glutamate N-acetyltransferase/amino-acid N-acetyltransferase